jgi:hypothetical protein
LKEFDQAWEHYRHVERTRAQYLGFLFTLTLAASGAAIPLVGTSSVRTQVGLVTTVGFLFVLDLVASLIYLAVRRIGAVLTYYESLMNEIRRLVFPLDLAPMLSIRSNDDSTPRMLGIQGTTLAIVNVVQVLAFVAELPALVHLAGLRNSTLSLAVASLFGLATLVCALLWAPWLQHMVLYLRGAPVDEPSGN